MKPIFFFILISFNLMGARPSVEGLFKNGSNQDVTSNFVMFRFLYEIEENKESIGQEPEELKNSLKGEISTRFILNEGKVESLLLFAFSKDEDKKSALVRKFYKKYSSIEKDLTSLEDKVFWGLLEYLVLNKSEKIIKVLSEIEGVDLSNKVLVNTEKLELLKKKKNYLEIIKNDKEMETAVTNPVESEDPEIAKKNKEILKSRFFKRSENVKLVKSGNKFFWELKLEKVEALFSVANHKIQFLKIKIDDNELSYTFDNFVLFNGVHELPSKVIVQDLKKNVKKIRFQELKHKEINHTQYINKQVEKSKEEKSKKEESTPLYKYPFINI